MASPDRQITKSHFQGLSVAAFESRMAAEMARLIERHGGQPHVAPALREIPLSDNTAVLEFGKRLLAGHFEMVILLTGAGTRTMVEILQTRYPLESIKTAIARTTVVARGPKPVAALKELGLTPSITVPEPNTWRNILQVLDERGSLIEVRIAVQEYGVSNPDLLTELRQRGAQVTQVPIYKWALPEDTAPLRRVLDAIVAGQVDVLLITNAAQIDHVIQVLEKDGKVQPFRAALKKMVVASIGPTASERLRHHDLPIDLEPSHPKMGTLVKETSEQAARLLPSKRSE
jgi:uroporphyrinogen-III synthase